MIATLVLFGVLAGPSAAAPSEQITPQMADQAARFSAAVDSARRLIENDVAAAVESLDRLAVESMDIRRQRPLSDVERPLHRQLFLLRANGHLQLLNNDKVEESFRELLRVDPFFTGQLAPREQEILDSLRAREGGVLEVSSPEPGSKVVLNGVTAGLTGDVPTRTPLMAGEYEVRLEKEGFQAGVTRVTILAGQTVLLKDLAPRRRIPPVAFLANREDLEIVVDNGAPVRMTKLASLRTQLTVAESSALDQAMTAAGLDPQTVAGFLLRDPAVDRPIVLRFRRDCFVEETRTIAVTSELLGRVGTEPLLWLGDSSIVRPQPDVGTLRVLSMPADADVFVDGQLVGRTPFERSVCTGQHRVRVRHRIGSFNAAATVTRGRTEVVDTVLKPGIAFIGAVDAAQSTVRYSADLAAQIERTLTATVTSFRATTRLELPPEMQRWTDASAVELLAALDKNDGPAVTRLLKLANDTFEAPLMVAAARRPGADAPVDLLVLWTEHAGVDHVRWTGAANDLAPLLARIDAPADTAELVYRNDLGIRVADVALPSAPLLVVRVDPGSPALAAGVKVGDNIEAVEGTVMNAQQLAERVRQKRPGEMVTLRVGGAGAPARQAQLPVQRRPRPAPAFDPSYYGNALIAKLSAASITAPNGAERDLLSFSLALAYMRFGDYKIALDLLATLNNVAEGVGVGRGAVLYFRGRCFEALADKDAAVAVYKEASAIDGQILAEDGATVSTLAKRRLASIGKTP